MAGTTRRGFLAAAGSGTAVAVVATASGASASPRSTDEALEALDGAVLVAYIDDPRSGVVSLMVGEEGEGQGPVTVKLTMDGKLVVDVVATGTIQVDDEPDSDVDGVEPWALLRGLIDDLSISHDGDITTLSMSWAVQAA